MTTHDRVGDGLELLLLLLVLLLACLGGSIEPRDRLGDGLVERGLVVCGELLLQLAFHRIPQVVGIGLEPVLGGDCRKERVES